MAPLRHFCRSTNPEALGSRRHETGGHVNRPGLDGGSDGPRGPQSRARGYLSPPCPRKRLRRLLSARFRTPGLANAGFGAHRGRPRRPSTGRAYPAAPAPRCRASRDPAGRRRGPPRPLRMVGTLLAEQDDEWHVVDRRYFSTESMLKIGTEVEGGELTRELVAAIA